MVEASDSHSVDLYPPPLSTDKNRDDLSKVQIRGEYELYDASDVNVSMLSMLSLGVVYHFN